MSKHINEVVLELEQKREGAVRKCQELDDLGIHISLFYAGEAEGYRVALEVLKEVETE